MVERFGGLLGHQFLAVAHFLLLPLALWGAHSYLVLDVVQGVAICNVFLTLVNHELVVHR